MLIPIPHDDFQQKTLSLKPTGFLKGPGLVLGDEPVHGSKLKYQVMDDIGRLRNVELKI